MQYWLFKSEPETFSIEHLKARPGRTDHWDGVRNYQARNFIRDDMRRGDKGFFYHSNCSTPGIVGTVCITREAFPDPTALDPESPYFDPKSTPDNPRWFVVDVRHEQTFRRTITLQELKTHPELDGMALLKKGNRLSVMPVSEQHWNFILSLA